MQKNGLLSPIWTYDLIHGRGHSLSLDLRDKRERIMSAKGSLVFFEGHDDYSFNLDNMDEALDNTYGQQGGRPNLIFSF